MTDTLEQDGFELTVNPAELFRTLMSDGAELAPGLAAVKTIFRSDLAALSQKERAELACRVTDFEYRARAAAEIATVALLHLDTRTDRAETEADHAAKPNGHAAETEEAHHIQARLS